MKGVLDKAPFLFMKIYKKDLKSLKIYLWLRHFVSIIYSEYKSSRSVHTFLPRCKKVCKEHHEKLNLRYFVVNNILIALRIFVLQNEVLNLRGWRDKNPLSNSKTISSNSEQSNFSSIIAKIWNIWSNLQTSSVLINIKYYIYS